MKNLVRYDYYEQKVIKSVKEVLKICGVIKGFQLKRLVRDKYTFVKFGFVHT